MTRRSHLDNLISNINEVRRLLEIHEEVSGTGRGRRRDVEVLNKSGIVLLVACWESYIENLAEEAFNALYASATTPAVFPTKVLALASRELREAPDERRVWELAGDGWHSVLQRHRDAVLTRFVGSLNTPKPEQITAMFSDLIGLADLPSCWRWKKTSVASAKERLTQLVTLRGDIAHRVVTSETVRKIDVVNAANFLSRLAVVSSNSVREFVHRQTGRYPWPVEQFVP